MATTNIGKLQALNDRKITSVIDKLSHNTAVERGEDLDSDSVIEDILYNWAGDIVKAIDKSWEEKGFNPASTTQKAEPHIIDRAGVLKVLQLQMPESWIWAENGRRRGKRPPIAPIERWITYRGIDVKKVKQWERKSTDESGSQHLIKPYKNINDTLKLRHIMAEAISTAIGRRGTIKRFGYKGSKFLSDVVNDTSLQELSRKLSEAVGYTIAVRIAETI